MVSMAGTETEAVETVAKTLAWKKQGRYGPGGEVSKSMPEKCLYVPIKDILAVLPRLMRMLAFRGSCPRADLDE